MAPTERPLQDSRSVVLDGSGNGVVTFGPGRPNTQWRIERISVQVSSNTNEPEFNVYRGTPNPGTFITGTYSGSNDTDSQVSDSPLFPGEYYSAVWSGGDAGARAIVSFGGTELIGF
jgi:hypothetical protein